MLLESRLLGEVLIVVAFRESGLWRVASDLCDAAIVGHRSFCAVVESAWIYYRWVGSSEVEGVRRDRLGYPALVTALYESSLVLIPVVAYFLTHLMSQERSLSRTWHCLLRLDLNLLQTLVVALRILL